MTSLSDWRSSDRTNGLSDERKWESLDNLILKLDEDSAIVRRGVFGSISPPLLRRLRVLLARDSRRRSA